MLLEKIQLEPGEEILKTVRKHWFVIVIELLATFLMLLFPFFILFLIVLFPNLLGSLNFSLSHFTNLIMFGISAWSIFCLMIGFMTWTHYYLDLWIITDRRIIAVDQIAFFNRNISVFRLERLQDIEVVVNGIIATFLNFGTINAQTAGQTANNFRSTGIPDPRGLQATIQSAMDARLATLHIRPSDVE